MQGELKDDVPEGKWEWYDENGNIVQSATFKNGIPDQESIFLAPGTEGVIEEEVTIEPEEAETAPAPAAENNK
jgi:antitoxin component YwqK of YwqJK toxin-antitoxin module